MRTLAIVATLVVAGSSAAANPRQIETDSRCPDFARGATLSVEPIAGGVTMEITTRTPRLAPELRDLTRALAGLLEEQSNEVVTRDVAQRRDHQIPPVTADVREIPSGVRVTVRVRRSRDVDTLRLHALLFEQFWHTSECITGSVFASLPSISA